MDDDAVEHAGRRHQQQRDARDPHVAVARQCDRGHQRGEEDHTVQHAALDVRPERRRRRAVRDPPGQRHIERPPQRDDGVADRIGDARRRHGVVEHARDTAQDVIDAVPEMDHEGEPGAGPEHQPERAGAARTTQHVGADRGNEQDDRDEDRVDRHVVVEVGRARALPRIADRRQVSGREPALHLRRLYVRGPPACDEQDHDEYRNGDEQACTGHEALPSTKPMRPKPFIKLQISPFAHT